MSWSRHRSRVLELMVEVLRRRRKPLTLREIVAEIHRLDGAVLAGQSPVNSLYSILYRHRQRRAEGKPISHHDSKPAPAFVVSTSDDGRKLISLQ